MSSYLKPDFMMKKIEISSVRVSELSRKVMGYSVLLILSGIKRMFTTIMIKCMIHAKQGLYDDDDNDDDDYVDYDDCFEGEEKVVLRA